MKEQRKYDLKRTLVCFVAAGFDLKQKIRVTEQRVSKKMK